MALGGESFAQLNAHSPVTPTLNLLRNSLSLANPFRSLQAGRWVKLICGASYQDMPMVRRLVMLYALAGVDCVDVAADVAVVAAARQGLEDAVRLASYLAERDIALGENFCDSLATLPWLMVSLNDSEDPHFRKAYFEAVNCPPDCDRPCTTLCPTAAIQFTGLGEGGVLPNLCYGCGRCIAICPVGNIVAQFRQASLEDFPRDRRSQIDAVEIHTQVGRQAEFKTLWQRLEPWRSQLKLISISCPDHGQVVPYLGDLYRIMAPLEIPLIWQADGRPMSGDLGKGTTHATIRLAQKLLQAGLPGYVQLAGGTNGYTVSKLQKLGLVRASSWATSDRPAAPHPSPPPSPTIAGIAYGSYARTLVMPMLANLEPELEQWLDRPTVDDVAEQAGVDKSNHSCPCSRMDSMPPIGPTSALTIGLAQARQLVGALKDGGG